MIRIKLDQLEVYQFKNLASFPEINHCVTTRFGGNSKGHLSSFNLGAKSGDNMAMENRKALAEALKLNFNSLIFPLQTHSTNFKIITSENISEPTDDLDALITTESGIGICSLGADCVPILLYEKKKKIIASIHAGWKGTVNGILDKVLNYLINNLDANPGNIIAGIGPSICAENYEVGPEVIKQYETVFDNAQDLISKRSGDKGHIDLWEANRTWLLRNNVPTENIEVSELCTYKNHSTFYSARYFKNQTGRFAVAITLRQ